MSRALSDGEGHDLVAIHRWKDFSFPLPWLFRHSKVVRSPKRRHGCKLITVYGQAPFLIEGVIEEAKSS